MLRFVKSQTGKTTMTLDVLPEDTIQDASRKLVDDVGMPTDQQQPTFSGKTTEDGYRLHHSEEINPSLESCKYVLEGKQVFGRGY